VVCSDFCLPAGYIPQVINPARDDIRLLAQKTGSDVNRRLVPFIACGDLNGLSDADEGKSAVLEASKSVSNLGCNLASAFHLTFCAPSECGIRLRCCHERCILSPGIQRNIKGSI